MTCTKTETYKNPFMYRVCQYNMTHFEVLDNQLCIGAETWGNISDDFELKFSELSQAELKRYQAESSRAGYFIFRAETKLDYF